MRRYGFVDEPNEHDLVLLTMAADVIPVLLADKRERGGTDSDPVWRQKHQYLLATQFWPMALGPDGRRIDNKDNSDDEDDDCEDVDLGACTRCVESLPNRREPSADLVDGRQHAAHAHHPTSA